MTLPATSQPLPTPYFNPICLKPTFMPDVIDRLANGEMVLNLCKDLGIKYSELLGYVTSDSVRHQMFTAAVKAGEGWLIQRLSQELHNIGLHDIKDALDSSGCVRPIEEIPEALRRTIAGIEVEELYEMQGREKVYIGRVKKIKLIDKTKAIEMLGKKLDMFIDKVHVSGEVFVKHSVERFDLEERIAALKQGRPLPATIQAAQASSEAVSVIEAELVSTPGDDI